MNATLRSFVADGQIVTDSGKLLVDEIGEMPMVVVSVEYVSPVRDGVVYATARGADGGTALVVLDAQDHAEAVGWLTRGTVRLVGVASLVLGQPCLDLRRTQRLAVAQ
ncbi:hypothetical protein [Streptomyces niveus]|uniref:hypothetical protein n=1 Tax=Streptomyces niveus TaxID=193462 RepID=UPI0034178186